MVDFYAALKKNQSLARALQQAEIKLLKEPRFCHPFYWAPFELIGDWR
ncbi:CHAT domain-containing protein [bacterium]|nr:CHAT domain-containing protein [bacterium]